MKDKLIELIIDSFRNCTKPHEVCSQLDIEAFADYLIAHGVTLGEWVSVEERLPEIERIWAMPNKWTFLIKPIQQLLKDEMNGDLWIDPFAGKYSPAKITNNLNPENPTDYHMDALAFLKTFPDASVDGVLYDPPYSPRQVRECYDSIGIEKWDGRTTFWSDTKSEVARIVKPGGKVICCGWNSMGIGKTRGFAMRRILLVPHGGSRNDTLCTVEQKMPLPEPTKEVDHETC